MNQLSKVKLGIETYRDKVYGCWIGKNAGGTLGGPLEQMFGQEEMFDVWWYPKLVEGGIPNDDLEIQLVWLQAIRDRGIYLTARDLAEYWLDCISYNPDEYGLNKTNLRKGLQPPVSGWYNNWFKDCMGSPIRSEIWACIAPGAPNIAAQYAYEDAICDHAGGESVYGEIFNATLESVAFLIGDRTRLVEIGLSMIPQKCLTAKAIRTAVQSFNNGLDWKKAREHVKEAVFSPIAQYSPINLGFQTIGLLYGKDFGDAICKAVNCGWDTDCTGATVGSIWGIINGKSGIPKKWIEPLGDKIIVSEGMRNLHAPADLHELTDEVCAIGKKVLVAFEAPVELCALSDVSSAEDVIASSIGEVKKLWNIPPNRLDFDLVTVKASITYLDGPAVLPNVQKSFNVLVENVRPEPISGSVTIQAPHGWVLEPSNPQRIQLKDGERAELRLSITASAADIDTSNKGTVEIALDEKPGLMSLPLIFVGSFRWLVSNVFREFVSLDTSFHPEKDAELQEASKEWKHVSWPENSLEIEPLFEGRPGILYLRHFIYSPNERKVILGVPNNNKMRLWLNGKVIHETQKVVPLRPNYSGDGLLVVEEGTFKVISSNCTIAVFQQGWNCIMIKILRGDKPIEAHFTVAHSEWHRGMADLIECRFPWE